MRVASWLLLLENQGEKLSDDYQQTDALPNILQDRGGYEFLHEYQSLRASSLWSCWDEHKAKDDNNFHKQTDRKNGSIAFLRFYN